LSATNRPLTARGRAQARAVAEAVRDVAIDAAYASDMQRARETAEIVLAGRDLTVTQLPELRERSYGSWEGVHDDEVEARFAHELDLLEQGRGDGAPDSEPRAALVARVESAVRRIRAEHPDGTVLVVAHSGPVRAIHALVDGVELRDVPEVGHCDVRRLQV
jgi:broad specificity phosphatase PhoE